MITISEIVRIRIGGGRIDGSIMALLLVAFVIIPLASCGGGSSMDAMLEPAEGIEQPAIEELSGDGGPAFPGDRNVSEQVTLELLGKNASEKSSGATVSGNSMIIAGSGMQYATYEFVPGEANALALNATVRFGTNASLYVQIANYRTGRWQTLGPYSSATLKEIDLSKDDYVSQQGGVFVSIVLGGGQSITIDEVAIEVDQTITEEPNTWPSGVALQWINQWYIPLNAGGAYGVYGSAAEKQWADAIFAACNAERSKVGLPALQREAHLDYLAQAHTRHFTSTGFWSHTNPQGMDAWDRLNAIDPANYNTAGENMAAENESAQEVVAGWMASPGHKANILKPAVTHMGIGVVINANGEFKTGATQLVVEFKENPAQHNWIEPGESK